LLLLWYVARRKSRVESSDQEKCWLLYGLGEGL
jgi:hypothetical protein